MKKIFLLSMLVSCFSIYAQQDIPAITEAYIQNANIKGRLSEDDLTSLLEPLHALKLDNRYMLMDFRKMKARMDNSALRLSVRKKDMKRPSDDYLEKEYIHYKTCLRDNKPYKAHGLSYISPLEKIRLDDSNESIWQAVLLHDSEFLFGMRWHANYQRAHLITCQRDIEKIVEILSKWENKDMGDVDNKNLADDAHILAYSLKHINNPHPTFYRGADTIYVERYVFWEFQGLVKEVLAVSYDAKKHKVRNISVSSMRMIAAYERNAFF